MLKREEMVPGDGDKLFKYDIDIIMFSLAEFFVHPQMYPQPRHFRPKSKHYAA